MKYKLVLFIKNNLKKKKKLVNPLRLQYSWQEKVVQERFLLGANLWLRLHISKHVFQCCFISDLYHKMEICYLNKIIIIIIKRKPTEYDFFLGSTELELATY